MKGEVSRVPGVVLSAPEMVEVVGVRVGEVVVVVVRARVASRVGVPLVAARRRVAPDGPQTTEGRRETST